MSYLARAIRESVGSIARKAESKWRDEGWSSWSAMVVVCWPLESTRVFNHSQFYLSAMAGWNDVAPIDSTDFRSLGGQLQRRPKSSAKRLVACERAYKSHWLEHCAECRLISLFFARKTQGTLSTCSGLFLHFQTDIEDHELLRYWISSLFGNESTSFQFRASFHFLSWAGFQSISSEIRFPLNFSSNQTDRVWVFRSDTLFFSFKFLQVRFCLSVRNVEHHCLRSVQAFELQREKRSRRFSLHSVHRLPKFPLQGFLFSLINH